MSPVYKFSNSGGFTTLQKYLSMRAGNLPSTLPMSTFSSAGSIPVSRSRPTPVTLGSSVYFLYGDTGGASPNLVVTSGTGNGTWTQATNMPYSCLGPFATNMSGTVYFGGGYSGGVNFYSTTNFSSFTQRTNYPISQMRSACSVPLNNKIYVSGGYSDGLASFVRSSYSWNGTAWSAETNFPIDTDTPAVWTYDGTSKYYWSYGQTYSYTGSGSYQLEESPPANFTGAYNNTTVYNGAVYLGSSQDWYSWKGSGGWQQQLSSVGWNAFGGTILNGVLYAKNNDYSTAVYKSTIGA